MLQIIALIAGFVFAIAATHIWVLPANYKTYSILVSGVAVAGTLGGAFCYKSWGNDNRIFKNTISTISGLVVAALVAFFSLFILLNVVGS